MTVSQSIAITTVLGLGLALVPAAWADPASDACAALADARSALYSMINAKDKSAQVALNAKVQAASAKLDSVLAGKADYAVPAQPAPHPSVPIHFCFAAFGPRHQTYAPQNIKDERINLIERVGCYDRAQGRDVTWGQSRNCFFQRFVFLRQSSNFSLLHYFRYFWS